MPVFTLVDENLNLVATIGGTAAPLANISTRMKVGTGDNVLIAGFIISGTEPKKLLLRGIGPSLTAAGVPGVLSDPRLDLYDSHSTIIQSNANWQDTQQNELVAMGLAPLDNREPAMLTTLAPGIYTVILSGENNTTGVGLIEVYDLSPDSASMLANISSRGFVQTNDNVMIGGFVVRNVDNAVAAMMVRGLGPSLGAGAQGISGALQNPTLEIHDSNGAMLMSNDDWKTDQSDLIQAYDFAPSDDRESAMVALLAPGPYTTILRGKDNTTGVGLLEIYRIQ